MAPTSRPKKSPMSLPNTSNPLAGSSSFRGRPAVTTEPTPTAPEVIRSGTTGRISGVTIGGKSFVGLSEEEVNAMLRNRAPQPTPEGTIEATVAARQREQQEKGFQLAENIGETELTGLGTSQRDIGQALSAGARTAIPTAAGGAALGLVGGPAAPVTVPIGAAGGLVAGFVGGFINNLKQQKAETISAGGRRALNDREQALRVILTDTNQHPENAADNLELFNKQLTNIKAEQLKLQLETRNTFLGEDGTEELAMYERFYELGGGRDYLVGQFQLALMNPDPTKNFITASDLASSEPVSAQGGFSIFG